MNVKSEILIREGNKLIEQWDRNRSNPEFADKSEWVRGVVYGLRLMYTVLARIIENQGVL